MLDKLTPADFEPHIGDTFTITYAEGEALEVTLAAVTIPSIIVPEGRRQTFVITFQSTLTERYLQQGTYPIAHAVLGTLTLFIVPHQPNATGFTYEAVFN
jgi:hypothetical protein